MNARASAETERLFRLHSQSPPRKLCVDGESLSWYTWLVRTGADIFFWVPRIRVGNRQYKAIEKELNILHQTVELIFIMQNDFWQDFTIHKAHFANVSLVKLQ